MSGLVLFLFRAVGVLLTVFLALAVLGAAVIVVGYGALFLWAGG